jgi:hypothetical protein
MSCKWGAVICNHVNTVALQSPPLTRSNIKPDIWSRASTNFNAEKKVMFIMVLHRLTSGLRFVMVHPHFICCYDAVKKCLTFILIVWKKNCWQFLVFELSKVCREHAWNPTAQTFQYTKSINNVTNMFLWNTNFESSFWVIHWYSLISSSDSLSHNQNSHFTIFTSFGPTMHNGHGGTTITVNKWYTSVNID